MNLRPVWVCADTLLVGAVVDSNAMAGSTLRFGSKVLVVGATATQVIGLLALCSRCLWRTGMAVTLVNGGSLPLALTPVNRACYAGFCVPHVNTGVPIRQGMARGNRSLRRGKIRLVLPASPTLSHY